ncbi:hypothetical protein KMS84_13600 [Streptomyces sp. IBSBF 2807]|nr:hypothetical protein [Streptomyces hilarionis]MCQ9131830.1 hypothetical protein [Streptomyces hilarionis]
MSTPVHLSSHLAVDLFDAPSLRAAFGVAGVGAVRFAESGLLIGVFLPGDSQLFRAGLPCKGESR